MCKTDTCYLTNREGPYDWRAEGVPPVARLRSAWSGIQVDVFTDQEAFQVYSCGGQNGSMALKETQGLFNVSDRPRTIPQYGCIVMEVEDWIDAINQPEWGRQDKQIYSPGGDPYVLQASKDNPFFVFPPPISLTHRPLYSIFSRPFATTT